MRIKGNGMRWSLSVRMAYSLGAIVLLIVVVCNVTIYLYFSRIQTQENLRKDAQLLHSNATQISAVIQDSQVIAQSLASDLELQAFCTKTSPGYYEIETIAKKLERFAALRHALHSITLVTEAQCVWSAFPMDQTYRDLVGNMPQTEYGLGEPITLSVGTVNQQILPYGVAVYALNEPRKQVGTLFLNLQVSYLENIVASWQNTDGGYLLLRGESALLGENDPAAGQILSLLHDRGAQEGVHRTDGGYVLTAEVAETPLTLATFRSDAILRGRADYLAVYFAVTTLLASALVMLCISRMVLHLTEPISALSAGMTRFAQGDMTVQAEVHTGDEIELLSNNFNDMVQSIRRLIHQAVEDEKTKKKFKFDMMISKINPHFIYNTLNSVIYLARREGNDDVVQVVRSLILILQDGMSIHRDLLYDKLSTELVVVEAYVSIQSYRYKNKFTLSCEAQPETLEWYVPKNILQPLVENAVFHGILPKGEPGKVTVCATVQGELLRLCVQDDGVGMPPDVLCALQEGRYDGESAQSSGVHKIALANIAERLEFLYPGQHTFRIDSAVGRGTTFVIELPVRREGEGLEAET